MQPYQIQQQKVKHDHNGAHHPPRRQHCHNLSHSALTHHSNRGNNQMRDIQPQMHKKCYNTDKEAEIIAFTDTVVEPDAVMIESLNAAFIIRERYRLH